MTATTSRPARRLLTATVAVMALGAAAAGCGDDGGGSGGVVVNATIAPLSSTTDAARFLAQASFGPTPEEVDFVQRVGYEYWIEYQALVPATRHLSILDARLQGATPPTSARVDSWWWVAVRGQDQLRQRVAFALSQLLVVSEVDISGPENTRALTNYYDLLAAHAFGNYRDLLEAVTLSPVMGVYLSHVRNEKAQPALNIRPDENYARELMQLFSIGLVRLNPDGTPQLDLNGDPIPTYDQETIEGYAAVFTGWTYAGTTQWGRPSRNMLEPMVPFEDYHDTGDKRLLDGQTLVGGRTAREDLEAALDSIFEHGNVGPFVSKQLIQRLVTSNPTPDYVRRVAAVFDDDGDGVRGNLKAVVRAILLDREARDGHLDLPQRFGKVREPVLRQSALWRAFHATGNFGQYPYGSPERDLAQAPLRSPSVFNFYRPDYAAPGEVTTAGLVSPELEILNESSITTTTNRWFLSTFDRYLGRPNLPANGVYIDIEREKALARTDLNALMNRLDMLLLSGAMSPAMRTTVQTHVEGVAVTTADQGAQRVVEAIYLIISSPEFALQR